MPKKTSPNKYWGVVLFVTLISALLFNTLLYTSIKSVEALPNGTRVEISPSEITVGNKDQTVPTTGYPFTVNVTVKNVTDLFGWQVRIYYYGYILNWTDAFYPPDHVFQGRQLVELPLADEHGTLLLENRSSVDFTNPLDTRWLKPGDDPQRQYNLTRWDDNDNNDKLSALDTVWLVNLQSPTLPLPIYSVKSVEQEASIIRLTLEYWYIQYGGQILAGQTFNGTGTLCQFNFTGVNPGVSIMNFSRTDTILLDSTAVNEIAYETVNGTVTVLGVVVGEETSEITLNVDKTSVKVGSNITISGDITPVKPNVNVTILYRPADGNWTVLQTVQTDSQSHYTYTWTTTTEGTFEIKASWPGDATHKAAVSDTQTVTVTAETPEQPTDIWTYLPYIAIAIVIILAGVLVYFLKIRKP